MKTKMTLIVVIIMIALTAVAVVILRRHSTDGVTQKATETSSEKTYFEPIDEIGNGIPFKTVTNTGVAGTNIYWVQQSVVDGQDGCILYDTTSKQIYANKYQSFDQIHYTVNTGSTYYTNDKVTKSKALEALNSHCFK